MTTTVSNAALPQPMRFFTGDKVRHLPSNTTWHRQVDGRWAQVIDIGSPFADSDARAALATGSRHLDGTPDDQGPGVMFLPRIPAVGATLPGAALSAREVDEIVLRPAPFALAYEAGLLPRELPGTSALDLDELVMPVAQVRRLLARELKDPDATASFHRISGRVFLRTRTATGRKTFIYVLTAP
ncbi:hypothetical protein [Streptacidiphilus sp. EB103A]|uniref:hypothetical protein n=1 Tax=Streptacidiphilus sp. EB103A TaxID=3156275 RepID=UPI003511FFAF